MKKFEDELIAGMQHELSKQGSKTPDLVKAAECLHAALEIFEEQGMIVRADQVLQVLEKLGQYPIKKEAKLHSLQQLMEAGITQRDLWEFARNSPKATAKLNLTLRRLGLSEHEITRFLGPGHLMGEKEALEILNPNKPGSILEFKSLNPGTVEPKEEDESLEFKSLATVKKKAKDPATQGLTPEKEIKNLMQHGHPLNVTMVDDCAIEIPLPFNKKNVTDKDIDSDFMDLMDVFKSDNFDIDASDDELMGMEVNDDLEVLEADMPLEDFEDERL